MSKTAADVISDLTFAVIGEADGTSFRMPVEDARVLIDAWRALLDGAEVGVQVDPDPTVATRAANGAPFDETTAAAFADKAAEVLKVPTRIMRRSAWVPATVLEA